MYATLVVFHIIFASIWIGGHILLLLRVLPKALKEKNPKIILEFEASYETIGIPSLILQIISGILLFTLRVESISELFDWTNFYGRHLILKLFLLLLTIALAIHARFRILPNLKEKNMILLGLHIFAVTLLSIGFALVGVSLRFNLFY
ncbi:MAG: CopD family protein [Leptonema sp. (in: bacteria)]